MTSPEQNIVIAKSLGYAVIEKESTPYMFTLSLGNGFVLEIDVTQNPAHWKAVKNENEYQITSDIVPPHGRRTAEAYEKAYQAAILDKMLGEDEPEQEIINAPEEPKPEPKDLTAIQEEKARLRREENERKLAAMEAREIEEPAESKKPEPKKQEIRKENWKTPSKTNSAKGEEIIDAQYVDYSTVEVPTLPAPVGIEIVRPAVTAQQALAAWREFQELKKYIIEPSDLQEIVTTDKRTGEKKKSTFVKKSGWRKFATFYNLTDRIVEEIKEPTATNGYLWKIKVVCTAPNGRETEGVGMCSSSERGFAHPDHDIYSTAHTRAKNRAISDMIAAGEVSYEEVA